MAQEPHAIMNFTSGRLVCEQALITDQPLRRMRGLVGRPALPAGERLLLQPAPSAHMVGETPARGICVGHGLGLPSGAGDASLVQVASRSTELSAPIPGRDNQKRKGRDYELLKLGGGAADPIQVLLIAQHRRFCSVNLRAAIESARPNPTRRSSNG